MVIEAHRNMLADFFRQREMQRDALPDAEAEAEVERLGQIAFVFPSIRVVVSRRLRRRETLNAD